MVMIDDSDFYEDDEDPQAIRAAFDRGPHGVTASGGARILCGNGFAEGGFIKSDAEFDKLKRELTRLTNENHELRRQLESARDLAIRCGAWQNGTGTDYEAHLEAVQDESARRPLVDPDGLLFGGAS